MILKLSEEGKATLKKGLAALNDGELTEAVEIFDELQISVPREFVIISGLEGLLASI